MPTNSKNKHCSSFFFVDRWTMYFQFKPLFFLYSNFYCKMCGWVATLGSKINMISHVKLNENDLSVKCRLLSTIQYCSYFLTHNKVFFQSKIIYRIFSFEASALPKKIDFKIENLYVRKSYCEFSLKKIIIWMLTVSARAWFYIFFSHGI